MSTAKGIVSILKSTDSVVDIVLRPSKKDPTLFKFMIFCEDFTSEAYLPCESTVSLKAFIKRECEEYALGNPESVGSFEEYMESVGNLSRFLDALECVVKKAQQYNWIRTPEDFAEAKAGGVILDKIK